mmetsp:Transcript_14195/g.36786  ORF Transcript_14195/g.36786 Transcript_14195/m.36786 type:complete len:288 (-) Transcript_14195:148-1011(-)
MALPLLRVFMRLQVRDVRKASPPTQGSVWDTWNRLSSCPIWTDAVSFWLRLKRFRWLYAKEPMGRGTPPSVPCTLRPPPALRPPVFRSTIFKVRSTLGHVAVLSSAGCGRMLTSSAMPIEYTASMSRLASCRLYTRPGLVVSCRMMISGFTCPSCRASPPPTGTKRRLTCPTRASATVTVATPPCMSTLTTWPKMPRSSYHPLRLCMPRLKRPKLSVRPCCGANALVMTHVGSALAPATTTPESTGLGSTLMVSFTPSRVSSAAGSTSEKYPVANTRCTSSSTSLSV